MNGIGPRRMRQPYWVRSNAKDSELCVFQFINDETDVLELEELIGQGRVYVRAGDVERYGGFDN